jgi:SulP family sulfate permease
MAPPEAFARHEEEAENAENREPRKNPLLAFTEWLPLVNRQTIGADVTAGLTGALVVLPQGVAFATLAGMPPAYGLYAGMVPAIIAAFFGSSWHLVSGPTTAASLLIFTSISAFAHPGTADYVSLVLTLTFMVGFLELLMGLMRMGALVNFISHTVAVGFTAGAAILIAVNQLKNLLGVEVERGRHFYDTLLNIWHDIHSFSPAALGVGLSAIAMGVIAKKLFPRIPNMIIALVGTCVLTWILNDYFAAGIVTIDAIPASLPPLSAPNLSADTIRDLAPTAVAVTIFALTEAMSISRALAIRSGQHVDGNQEFIGQGLSNLVGCFFSSYVATGSFNRSGLNYDSGARTPMAAILAGLFLVGVVLLVAPLAVYLPKAGMAGILFLVAWNLIDVHHMRQIVSSSRSEAAVLAVTFFSVLFLDLELAIFAGVILSLVFYLNRTSHPNIAVLAPRNVDDRRQFSDRPNLPECPQAKIIRIDGALYFGAVASVVEDLHRIEGRSPEQRHLIVLASGVHFIDITGAEALANEAKTLRKLGGALYLVAMTPNVEQQFRKTGLIDAIGEDNIFQSKTAAFASIYSRLDHDICKRCTKRIFWECRNDDDAVELPRTIHPAMKPYLPPEPETPAPIPAPVSAREAAKAERPAEDDAKSKHVNPKRILALVDLESYPRETVEMAARLATEYGSELALGSVIQFDITHHSALALNIVSESLVSSLRGPAQARLGGLASNAGFPNSETLISNKQDPREATLDMITDWHPDLLVLADHGVFDTGFSRHVTYRTPSGVTQVAVRRFRPSRRKRQSQGRD